MTDVTKGGQLPFFILAAAGLSAASPATRAQPASGFPLLSLPHRLYQIHLDFMSASATIKSSGVVILMFS